jgi:tryptophanyl-tRNA synthetase
LHGSVQIVLIEFLACGLDPEKATIYIQSDLPETAELYLLLNMNAYVGELERCTSFKEKIRQQPDNVNAGLLTYPTLMAADIIIHKAHKVPVGKDQEQHLEMTRTFANRFNRLYKVDFFPEPEAYNFGDSLVKIPGLDGSMKMSKSDNDASAIFLADSPESIRKKVMRAVTDAGPTEMNQPKPQAVENLFSLMKIMSSVEAYDHFNDLYNRCQIRYGDMKKQLAEDLIRFTEPFREKIKELYEHPEYLRKVVSMGAEKARASGSKTVREVREIIGFKRF